MCGVVVRMHNYALPFKKKCRVYENKLQCNLADIIIYYTSAEHSTHCHAQEDLHFAIWPKRSCVQQTTRRTRVMKTPLVLPAPCSYPHSFPFSGSEVLARSSGARPHHARRHICISRNGAGRRGLSAPSPQPCPVTATAIPHRTALLVFMACARARVVPLAGQCNPGGSSESMQALPTSPASSVMLTRPEECAINQM